MPNFGRTTLLEFRNFRERVVWIAVQSIVFHLSGSLYKGSRIADYIIVLWRALRYIGSDEEMQHDDFLAPFGDRDLGL